jgi:anti-sigma B factor antagonist
MEIIEKNEQNISIFEIHGRLDSNTSPEFDKKIFDSIDLGSRHLIVDCENLEYITSAGLRVLNKTAKRLKGDQGAIVLCSMKDYVREVFEISGFDTFLPIVTNLDDAVQKQLSDM